MNPDIIDINFAKIYSNTIANNINISVIYDKYKVYYLYFYLKELIVSIY